MNNFNMMFRPERFNEKTEHLFWHYVSVCLDDVEGHGYQCFKSLVDAQELFEQWEGTGEVKGKSGLSAAKEFSEVLTDQFYHKIDSHFLRFRRPTHHSKKSIMHGVDLTSMAVDLIHKACKENNLDPSQAVIMAFGDTEKSIQREVPLKSAEQRIAQEVAEMFDRKLGKRIADIEMTMGIIEEEGDAF